MVQCLQHLLIQSDHHDVWPNVEFIATFHRMRLVWYQKPLYIYEIPTLCTLGARPAILSFMNCRKTWSKQPGSSWAAPGRPGRQVHPFVPARRTRNSPPCEDGQSSTVALCVTNFGPACIADAIFSTSDFVWPDGGA